MHQALNNVTFEELNKKINTSDNDWCIWYPRKHIRNTTFNIIYCALFGKCLQMNDKIYTKYVENTNLILQNVIFAMIKKTLPTWIGDKLLLNRREQLFEQALTSSYQQTGNDFDELSLNIDINSECKSETLVECMIYEYNENGIKIDSKMKKKLISDIFSLIAAGMDTTSHASEVGVLLLAKYPQIQSQIYKVE